MDKRPTGRFVEKGGEQWYEIRNYDKMQPFFISLASDTDLWMYLASTGGLTAGRRSPNEALFPYYTDDKITESYEFTGPRTVINQWRPFSNYQQPEYDIARTISKSTVGNKIMFTEENLTLGLRFSYMWAPAGKFGWVRRATLENLRGEAVDIELTDSLKNVLPAGVERKTQNEFSTLVDGYKKTEVTGSLALFRMEAILVDRAEPSESLTCNTVYCLGLRNGNYEQSASKGVRGAFVAQAEIKQLKDSVTWYDVLDVSQDAVAVHEILHFIKQADAIEQIEAAIRQSTENLREIVSKNDGVQHTGDEHNDARHFANTLFNTMRGGYYLDNYQIGGEAFRKHVELFNKAVAKRHEAFLKSLPEKTERQELEKQVKKQGDMQLTRLLAEYLPITFGRRHGDPSRPWNLFSIRVQDAEGNPLVSYQGNWRDIFQNWEALSVSYPGYVNGIISKFLNATTADGYNPYKVSSEGIDWEVIDKENPWSNIGYWGDHQIIYLLKLLELSRKHDPEALTALLNKRAFAFANVPYRFKSYEDIVADPKNTILFDEDLHKHILGLIPEYGEDARLMLDKDGEVVLTTMADKLLITLLQKMTNFIPYAGVWMNTLRPEWNDANNALVGNGASMVTACYMLRYVKFLKDWLEETKQQTVVSSRTWSLMDAVVRGLRATEETEDRERMCRKYIDAAGKAGEEYRTAVYGGDMGEMMMVKAQEIADSLGVIYEGLRKTIEANKREDGLYHAYNLVRFTEDRVEITHLYEMLEGQVAVLSSGLLSGEEAADLLDAMRKSALYREDQRNYMLYPNRRRKSFLEMNNVPEEMKSLPVVKKYLGTVLKQDRDGGIHFDARYRNAYELPEELKDLYEQIFNHQAFTGRSGTFYKYEGLGCIYWHMVSKLLLAVGERIEVESLKLRVLCSLCSHDRQAVERSLESLGSLSSSGSLGSLSSSGSLGSLSSSGSLERLKEHYRAIREGIGSHKQPEEYGSFPFDPYSHTPSMAGVQQPGMTGQVKEDILNRFFELGVSVDNGQITFCPQMLTAADFTDGELSFTYCNTPVIYRQGEKHGIKIETEEESIESQYAVVGKRLAAHVFARDGYVKRVTVTLAK